MKILQISAVYKQGSVGKIVSDIHNYLLKQGVESYVCYGVKNKNVEPTNNVMRCGTEFLRQANHVRHYLTGMEMDGCHYSTQQFIKKIKEIKPDIVHVHCMNDYYLNSLKLLKFLGENKIKTIFTLHCEHSYTGSCGYALNCDKWKNGGCDNHCHFFNEDRNSLFPLFDRSRKMWLRMNKAFSYFENNNVHFCSCTPWLDKRLSESTILSRFTNHTVIFNGADSEVYKVYDNLIKNEEKKRTILYVCPRFTDPIKGATQINEIAKRFLNDENISFRLAGRVPQDYKFESNITTIGPRYNTDLAKEYSSADVSIMLSKAECFPMVCVESVLCGTKVVAFKCGGPDEAYSPDLVRFVDPKDYDGFAATIREILNSGYNKSSIEKTAKRLYSQDVMAKGYYDTYINFLGK